MAEYESIHGTRVRYLSSDPTLTDSSTEGQVWYNSTTGTNKALVQIKAWSSGGNMGTARRESGAAGTQTASVVFGGGLPPGNPDTNATEEYNGFGYTTGGTLNTAREGMGAAGTLTAALGFGGATYPSPGVRNVTEGYDGSSWTSLNNLQSNRSYVQGFGTQTAAIAVGGAPDSPVNLQTESWDGTNWTNLPAPSNVPVGMLTGASAGTQTAGVTFGGSNVNDSPPGVQATTLDWNGSTWTAGNNMNTARRRPGGAGTSTAALGFGGYFPSPYSTATEEYDGNTWTTSSASLPTATAMMHGSGSMYAALSSGGRTSTAFTGATYEYNSNINAITQAAWASGGAASNTSARGRALAGTQTAAFMSGGYIGANNQTRDTEEYNGSSWTSGGDLVAQGNNPPGGTYSGSAGGTQTAGLFIGGSSQGSTDYYFNTSYEYDGSSWGSPATFTSPGLRSSHVFGVQTAAVSAGGTRPGQPLVRVFEYDGSSWTAATNLPTGSEDGGASGILTAGIIFGGSTPSTTDRSLDYDGTNWTAAPTMIYANADFNSSGQGTQTAALAMRGYNGTATIATSQIYNGSSWSATATAATAVSSLQSGAGTSSAGLSAGGSPGAVEEFTGGTSVATASTLTTS